MNEILLCLAAALTSVLAYHLGVRTSAKYSEWLVNELRDSLRMEQKRASETGKFEMMTASFEILAQKIERLDTTTGNLSLNLMARMPSRARDLQVGEAQTSLESLSGRRSPANDPERQPQGMTEGFVLDGKVIPPGKEANALVFAKPT